MPRRNLVLRFYVRFLKSVQRIFISFAFREVLISERCFLINQVVEFVRVGC